MRQRNLRKCKEAYETLSDSQKRAQYDRFGHVDPNQGFGGGAGGFEDFGGFGDIFDMFFGGAAAGEIRTRRNEVPICNIR